MEDLLYEADSVRRFHGLSLAGVLPDESTILHFRHLLERHQPGATLLATINAQPASTSCGSRALDFVTFGGLTVPFRELWAQPCGRHVAERTPAGAVRVNAETGPCSTSQAVAGGQRDWDAEPRTSGTLREPASRAASRRQSTWESASRGRAGLP